MAERVWITGIGTANPLGTSYAETAANLLAGRCGITRVERFDADRLHSKVGGFIAEIPCPPSLDPKPFRQRDRMEQLTLWCAWSALHDAGLLDELGSLRVGVVLGNGGAWLRLWEADWAAGGRRIQQPESDQRTTVQILRDDLPLDGPVLTTAAACASGNYALAEAWKWLKRGWVDVCLAGAVDLTVSPMGMAAFGNLRALSTKFNNEPSRSSRPFDVDRDGFVMSEGGAMFVLEPESRARKRGALGRAWIRGFGARSDAFHLVIPSSDSEPMAAAMRRALQDAELNPEDIDYVNAHATSTPIGDVGEARAIRMALGEHAAKVAVSSTKGMTGHLICAAAAVETIACLAAFEHQAVPPTINLDQLDPECAGVGHVANEARPHPVRRAMNNSFGFGG
ncbi:MAG: beta-ketoacyl-[acyl-carrier-protein] synthase family protein, partial [Gemmataceae bacterium]|nr:beta-ketoacyl-[acyl-carrier-protein] synthase family protein [Gemmataceae bacterium]